MTNSNTNIHLQEEDNLELEVRVLQGGERYLSLSVGGVGLNLFLPANRTHELAVLLNKAAAYFGSVGCPECICRPDPNDQCPVDGYEAWKGSELRVLRARLAQHECTCDGLFMQPCGPHCLYPHADGTPALPVG